MPTNNYLSKAQVLIVEDDMYSYLLLKNALKNSNAELLWVKTGNEAINLVKENKDIDIALVDIALPDISGYQVTRNIKKLRQNMPVIAVTAYALPGDREKCLAAGCDEYISKPVSIYNFYNILEKWGIHTPQKELV